MAELNKVGYLRQSRRLDVVSRPTARNCKIADSFARGILLNKSPTVEVENNTLARCVVLKI